LLASASAVLMTVGAGGGAAGGITGVLPLNTGAGSRTVERRRGGSAAAGCGGGAATVAGSGAGSTRGV
jgi:hypothetical protein